MPTLTIKGVTIEYSGRLVDAIVTHLKSLGGGNPGFTLNGVKYTYAGVTGSVLNSGTDYHNVIHTDYGVWEHDNGDGTWAIVYSDGNWWVSGTTTHDPSTWTHRYNPEISDRVNMHWWGNDAHTVEETSGKYGPKDGVTWS